MIWNICEPSSLAGRLCGAHTLSLVALRTPALQRKGGEIWMKTDIIKLGIRERPEGEEGERG